MDKAIGKLVQKTMGDGEKKRPIKSIKLKIKFQRKAKRLSSSKAKKILKDNSAQGHPLTDKQKKFFGAIAGGAKPYKQRKAISIPKKELVEEHKELVHTLKLGTKSELKHEAKKQEKELGEYKAKRKLLRAMKGYRK